MSYTENQTINKLAWIKSLQYNVKWHTFEGEKENIFKMNLLDLIPTALTITGNIYKKWVLAHVESRHSECPEYKERIMVFRVQFIIRNIAFLFLKRTQGQDEYSPSSWAYTLWNEAHAKTKDRKENKNKKNPTFYPLSCLGFEFHGGSFISQGPRSGMGRRVECLPLSPISPRPRLCPRYCGAFHAASEATAWKSV